MFFPGPAESETNEIVEQNRSTSQADGTQVLEENNNNPYNKRKAEDTCNSSSMGCGGI